MSDTTSTEDTHNTGDTQHDRGPCIARIAALAAAVLLLLLGVACLTVGGRAIQKQRIEGKWRAVRAVGFAVREAHGTVQYQGTAAVRVGIGFVSVGLVFATWSTVLLSGIAGLRAICDRTLITALLGWMSFASLVVACGCFFPPWLTESASFYGVVLLCGVFTIGLRRTTQERRSRCFVMLVAAAVVAGVFGWDDVSVGIIVAIFAFVIGWAHFAMLVPRLQWGLTESSDGKGDIP